ncbi:unnamed protein product, partial [marine sediment metagenome]
MTEVIIWCDARAEECADCPERKNKNCMLWALKRRCTHGHYVLYRIDGKYYEVCDFCGAKTGAK